MVGTDGSETFTVTAASEADRADVTALLTAWDRHYRGERPGEGAAAADVAARILSGRLDVVMLLGRRGGRAVAFATVAVLHPGPAPGGTLFMKHLFVLERDRSAGAGTLVLRAVARHALQHGCSRVDWTARVDNTHALALYDRLKVPRRVESVLYGLGGEDLAAFAEGAEDAAGAGQKEA